MDKPKQRYPRSEANRLRPATCPDCGRKSGRPRIREDEGAKVNPLDPEVNVIWYCPNVTCNRHDGFWIEER